MMVFLAFFSNVKRGTFIAYPALSSRVGDVLVVDFMFNAAQEQLTDKEEAQMRDTLADDFLQRVILSFMSVFY